MMKAGEWIGENEEKEGSRMTEYQTSTQYQLVQ